MGTEHPLIEQFALLEPRDRLELLLDFSRSLPELPPEKKKEMLEGKNKVHECASPVFLWVSAIGGKVHIDAYVDPDAPTVKGFVSLLIECFEGMDIAQVSEFPDDLPRLMGISQSLGMQRSAGLTGIVNRIKKNAAEILRGQF